MKVVIYARVSNKDQEREGYSIPAVRLRRLHSHGRNKKESLHLLPVTCPPKFSPAKS